MNHQVWVMKAGGTVDRQSTDGTNCYLGEDKWKMWS